MRGLTANQLSPQHKGSSPQARASPRSMLEATLLSHPTASLWVAFVGTQHPSCLDSEMGHTACLRATK